MSASSSRAWWGPAVAVCASVAALAGAVAAVATAAGADAAADHADDHAGLTAAGPTETGSVPAGVTSPVPPTTTAPPVTTRPGRVGDPSLGATVATEPGWRSVRDQDLVPTTPGRFPTILTLDDRAAVLVGRLDPARGFEEDALAAEARRLAGAFADGIRGDADGRIAAVSDGPSTLDRRDAFTSVRRAPDGSLVRVTTVAGARGEPGLVLLAVAAPGRAQGADATAADRIVRSLSSTGADAPPPTTGRASAPPASSAPGAPPRVSPSSAPATDR